VTVVQVRGDEVLAEAAVVGRQVVVVADEDGAAVALDVERSRHETVEAPEWLRRKLGMRDDVRESLLDLIKLDGRN
jgi:hypothetical protein